ncbi:MAG: hypothetical protein SYC29_12970 [Planctomycetota bacterium]|nr:hypothetical protein [Planctomycetota bacterium]
MRVTIRTLLPILTVAALFAGCEPYRIEYHNRPAYYRRMTNRPLDERVVLEDGTILVYNEADPFDESGDKGEAPFRIREELEDGTVVLRALLPEHVLANTLECIRNSEYELLWDQMLSERTKLAYEEQSQGVEEFAAFFREHRRELARTLNRMLVGLTAHEVVVESQGNGVTVCRFWPQVARDFKFKQVSLVNEQGLKLLLIH